MKTCRHKLYADAQSSPLKEMCFVPGIYQSALFSKKVSVGVNRILRLYHPGWSGWALNPMPSLLVRNWREDTNREDHVKMWPSVFKMSNIQQQKNFLQPQAKECQSHQTYKKQKHILPDSLWREQSAANFLISDFWPSELLINFCLKRPILCNLKWQPQETIIVGKG